MVMKNDPQADPSKSCIEMMRATTIALEGMEIEERAMPTALCALSFAVLNLANKIEAGLKAIAKEVAK